MAKLSALRNNLAETFAAAGRVVYAYPNENTALPALSLVPGSPYLTPKSIGGASNRIEVRFELTAYVQLQDNQAGLQALESLMLDVFNLLPNGVGVDAWTIPQVEELNGIKRLTSSINIVVTTSN